MKKLTTVLILVVFVFYTTSAFALTAEQRAEQRRQQRAAQRAYESSARTYNNTARQAGTYKEGAEIIRDTVKEAGHTATRNRYR